MIRSKRKRKACGATRSSCERPEDTSTRSYERREGPDSLTKAPLAILIDGASASSAEIVAGALQDAHRATVVGSRSFGKGLIQAIVPLAAGGALRVTFAEYRTPAGRAINGRGLTPDIVARGDPRERGDTTLAVAVDALRVCCDRHVAYVTRRDGHP